MRAIVLDSGVPSISSFARLTGSSRRGHPRGASEHARIERKNQPTRTCFTTRCVFLVSRKTIAFAVECKDP